MICWATVNEWPLDHAALDDVGERAEDERGLEPRAGASGLGERDARGGYGLERLDAALAAGDPRGAAEAADLVRTPAISSASVSASAVRWNSASRRPRGASRPLHVGAAARDGDRERAELGDGEVVVDGPGTMRPGPAAARR